MPMANSASPCVGRSNPGPRRPSPPVGLHQDDASSSTAVSTKPTKTIAQHRMARRNEADASKPVAVPPMPWFGMDIGGTLTKLVYFEPTDVSSQEDTKTQEEASLLANIKHYLIKNKAYGQSGYRDSHLEMRDVLIDGRTGVLHFIRFPTAQMDSFVELAKGKGMANLASTVCATGGGAYKFEDLVEKEVGMKLHKFDELDSLMRGVEYMEHFNASELFYYENPQEEENYQKAVYQAGAIYPFILVNIGSGVSILSVKSPDEYRRVCGTSLGGGTFLGLCSLLTDCKDFEEALALAAKGDNKNVDRLVRDIYGGDYAKFGLQGDLVASSFGHMNDPVRRANARPEDLAKATLTTITNNIGSLVKLCAQAESLERVIFVGNFLRINSISMKMLASAMDFWSQGSTKALFCEHEGYYGAVGCLLELMKTP